MSVDVEASSATACSSYEQREGTWSRTFPQNDNIGNVIALRQQHGTRDFNNLQATLLEQQPCRLQPHKESHYFVQFYAYWNMYTTLSGRFPADHAGPWSRHVFIVAGRNTGERATTTKGNALLTTFSVLVLSTPFGLVFHITLCHYATRSPDFSQDPQGACGNTNGCIQRLDLVHQVLPASTSLLPRHHGQKRNV